MDELAILHSESVLTDPIYSRLGYKKAVRQIALRHELIELLEQVNQRLLRENVQLLLWDGWRPDALQAELWFEYRAKLKTSSGLDGEELDQLTKGFVNPPGVNNGVPAPHSTGAAIDITLTDLSGNLLDMGGEFDELSERTTPDYYDKIAGKELYSTRRELLSASLAEVGFWRLPTEWWHFEYGTHSWAKANNYSVKFGYLDNL